jgi:hypothetical protein
MAFDTDQDLEAISTKTRYSYSVMPLDNKTKVPVCRSCLPEWEHYKKSLEIWQQHLNDNRKKWWEIFKTPMKLPRPSPPRRR